MPTIEKDVIYPNRSDYDEGFWAKRYQIDLCAIGTITFRIAADCEQDAIDEMVDWIEANRPGLLMSRKEEDEEREHGTAETIEEYVYGGNHCRYLNVPSHEMRIECLGRNL
jgi:hypothetical protein